ncbi:GNAT family N-acetyltransferase [Fumia xinanensis]|uniref:GNAT family N-acetyltransferase n=1 Tax=Fumia xinanensis TaxID=2763659 RepID=A0A926E1K0_9FIRM|nr:GNAT family N-acetyltransferase [Fumia xinanensis]MBC8559611.1 GNAT family N-acetyltransferase [Fumia xinanensis]
MHNKLTFHAAEPDDLTPLLQWNLDHIKTYETAKLDWKQVEAFLSEKLWRVLPDCRAVRLNGEKAGYFALLRHPEYLELDNFWIFGPFQGQGLGSQILRYCKWEAKKAGLPLRLFVFCKNERAAELYRRAGFQERERCYESRALMEYHPEMNSPPSR